MQPPGIKKKAKLSDAIFIVTKEQSCPMYNVGEDIKVTSGGISISGFKPSCLILAKSILQLVSATDSFGSFKKIGGQKSSYSCGGCEGTINFEYKKEKEYATVQIKLLNEAEEKRKRQHLDKFYNVLRSLPIFEPLEDDALAELTLLLELKSIPEDRVLAKKGNPGTHLYILLKGLAAVIGDDGSKHAEIGVGEVFGEMSLLSGEPVTNSVHTIEKTYVALLSLKNFRQVIVKHPVLQMFLFKMLMDRAQMMSLKSGNIASGMTGELEEISVVDLFQLINSSQKTGRVELFFMQSHAEVFFLEGQIVKAITGNIEGNDAVFSLLNIKKGHFSYTKGLPVTCSGLQPLGDFMALLMEGLQRIDEDSE